LKDQIQTIVTVLPLVNSAICGMLFAQAERGRSGACQLGDATKAALAILAIVVVAALAGTRVLDLFGVSLDAFMVAAGGVLAWMGFSMPSGKPPASGTTTAPSGTGPSYAFDSIRRQSGNHYRRHHDLGCPHAIAASEDGPRCHPRGDRDDLAGHAARRAARRPTPGRRIPAGRDTTSRLMGLIVLSRGSSLR
jgi:hypothetical protein